MIIPERHLADTRSLKQICAYLTKDLAYIREKTGDFSKTDHFDSFCVFMFFTLLAIRRYGESSDEYEIMIFMMSFHDGCISKNDVEKEKESLDLVTSIDLRNHGANLVKNFLRE